MSRVLRPSAATAEPASVEAKVAAVLSALAQQISQDPSLITPLRGTVASAEATRDAQGLSALPDSPIADDDASGVSHGRFSYRQKDKDMPRYFGPYSHRGRWRIVVRHEGTQKVISFDTEEAARKELRKLRVRAEKEAGLKAGQAIERYEKLLTSNGLKAGSVKTTGFRLRSLFKSVLATPLALLTAAKARELVDALPGSVDTRKNTLAEAKTFWRRAREQGRVDDDVFGGIRSEGKRRYGKPKLTLDESKKFIAVCLGLAGHASAKVRAGGVASAMALIFGMRASEITGLQVKDLDAGGTVLRITRAKSRAGVRSLQVPTWFKPLLAFQAEGKKPEDLLIGRERSWLHRKVKAVCKAAGVSEVPPHGLRATHGDLALLAAATPQAVSTALGHESQATTFRHYADPAIPEAQDHAKAAAALCPTPRN